VTYAGPDRSTRMRGNRRRIEEELADAEDVAAGFAFFPEAAGGAGYRSGTVAVRWVHSSASGFRNEHQHFARGVVLNDRGDQPVNFAKASVQQASQKQKTRRGDWAQRADKAY